MEMQRTDIWPSLCVPGRWNTLEEHVAEYRDALAGGDITPGLRAHMERMLPIHETLFSLSPKPAPQPLPAVKSPRAWRPRQPAWVVEGRARYERVGPKDGRMTQSEYAVHRGVNEGTVSRWISSGRLTAFVMHEGYARIDPIEADKQCHRPVKRAAFRWAPVKVRPRRGDRSVWPEKLRPSKDESMALAAKVRAKLGGRQFLRMFGITPTTSANWRYGHSVPSPEEWEKLKEIAEQK